MKLVFTIISIYWSFLFLNFWRRREKELSYAFGTHMEEIIPEVRPEYQGKT
jgi:Calcium-activated chloride channel